MAKYYVESGKVAVVLQATGMRDAAVRAFQWSCDRQATIEADSPLEHVRMAERMGWQLEEEVRVSEKGFGRLDARVFDTRDIVAAWQARTNRPSPVLAGGLDGRERHGQ
jgi:hypothetical protein